jgi:hypothetical protein
MSQLHPTCEFCGAPSTLLCDGRIYTMPDGTERRVEMGFINRKTKSCDKRMCRACAHKITDVHLHTRAGCRWDTRDVCPLCDKVNQGA